MRYSPVRGDERLNFLIGSGWTLLFKGQARHNLLFSAHYDCPKYPVRWDIHSHSAPRHPSSASPSPNDYFMLLLPVLVMGPMRQGLEWRGKPEVAVHVCSTGSRSKQGGVVMAGAGVPRKALSAFPVSSEKHNPEITLVSFNVAQIFHSVSLHCQPSPSVLCPAAHLLTTWAVASTSPAASPHLHWPEKACRLLFLSILTLSLGSPWEVTLAFTHSRDSPQLPETCPQL